MPPFLTVMLTLRQWLINILIASGSKAALGDKKTRAFRVNQKEVKPKAARIVGIEGNGQPRSHCERGSWIRSHPLVLQFWNHINACLKVSL